MALRREGTAPQEESSARGVGRLILELAREMRTAFERELTPLGITGQQAELIYRTHRAGTITPNELTRLLLTDNAGVTRLLDRLEAKRLIARRAHPDDRRSVHVTLTASGRALIPRLRRVADAQQRRLLREMSAPEEARLRQLLERVLANVREGPA
jgi:DNA-binding MarR family transcriptional regulator